MPALELDLDLREGLVDPQASLDEPVVDPDHEHDQENEQDHDDDQREIIHTLLRAAPTEPCLGATSLLRDASGTRGTGPGS